MNYKEDAEMKKYELLEYIARYLCEVAGEDPDNYHVGFDREAADDVAEFGEYEGWRDYVFPKTYEWTKFVDGAYDWLRFCGKHKIDLLTYVNKYLAESK